jgi:hypothetical protein
MERVRARIGIVLGVIATLAVGSIAAAQTEFVEADGLQITELTLARNVVDGEAVDPTNTFSVSDGRVWVFMRIRNSTDAAADVRVSFERADREVVATTEASGAGVTLNVPSQRRPYRTMARTGTRAAGRYRVVVRSATSGAVLGTAEYEITQ